KANAAIETAANTSLRMYPPAQLFLRNARTARFRRFRMLARTNTEKVGERPLLVSRGGAKPMLRCKTIDHGRHCERSEAIHCATSKKGWIASSLRLLAMTSGCTTAFSRRGTPEFMPKRGTQSEGAG